MNNLVRTNDAYRQFYNDWNRLLQGWQGESGDNDWSRIATSMWSPAVDIAEESDRFVLYADLPGVDPKAIEVTMENGMLTIRGERSRVKSENGNGNGNGFGLRRTERVFGTFHRRFSLPDTADADNITAKGENGVLEISLPKKQQAQPRRITVS